MLVEPGQALEQAKLLARRIIANAPLAVAASKQVIVEQRDWPIAEMFTREEAITGHLLTSGRRQRGRECLCRTPGPVLAGRMKPGFRVQPAYVYQQ